MHLKRQESPKKWTIPRKGSAYVVRPRFNLADGVPVLLAIRDMLKIAQNRKEVKKALHEKMILLNGSPVRDERQSLVLFDILTIVPVKKSYRLEISDNQKILLVEISEKENSEKISKIVDKKKLKGKKTQLNFNDGKNILSDVKCSINDSVRIDFKTKKIKECIPFRENAMVFVFEGKHAGKRGKVEKIDTEKKMVELSSSEGKVNALIKQIIVTG